MSGEVEVQWSVTHFPFDGPDRTWTGSEEACRRRFRLHADEGTNPILSRREVVIGMWETVANAADSEADRG